MLGGMRRRALGRRVWRRVASPASLLALASVASVAVIGVVLFVHLRAVGVAEAEREAERQAQLAAHGVVEPLVTQELVDGDPAAIDRHRSRRQAAGPHRPSRAGQGLGAGRADPLLRRAGG